MKKFLFIITSVMVLNLAIAFCQDENITVNTLPSGQKVIIKEVHDNAIVKIDTWINTGSINEDDSTTGISHFLEHLFFKGTTKHPTGEMDAILDSKGAEVNAATSKDFTHYYIEIPSKDFDLALELHSDMLLNPLIPRKELERERGVVIEEISKCKDSPKNRLFDNLYSIIYSRTNHPYQRPIIGKKEVIERVSREEILDYFNRFYTPDAYTTIIVGDVNKDEALKKVAASFERPKSKQQTVKYPHVKPLDKVERKVETMDINKTHFMIGFLAPKFSIYKDNYALDVLATMLTGGKSSILNQQLKENKELVLSISSGNYSKKDSGIFYIYANFEPQKEQEVENEIIAELQKIKDGDFDEALIKKAKNQIKTETYYQRESISNISDDIGYDFTFSGDIDYYQNYLKNIDKVTKQDIISAAKKYLIFNGYAVSSVRPDNFKEIANKVPSVKQPDNKLIEQKDNTKKYLLDNGATLITKNKTINSIIAIDIAIKGSKAIEKKPLTAMLAASGATVGSNNYTNAQFSQFLDENGIKLGVSSSNDIFSIVIQVTKDNLDKAFIALNEVVNYPIFPENELNKIKTRNIQAQKGVSDNPSGYVFDEFRRLAFLNSIYGQNSTFVLNNIDKVKRDDIVEFYQRVINPENMTIAVVGDVDDEYIKNKLNEIIKPNPKGKKFSYSNMDYNPYHPQNNVNSTLYKNEVQAHWLALGYKIPGVTNRRDIAVLSIINSILGEGMSSRLFRKLREEKSLAYTVGSSLITNVLDGVYVGYIGTNADSVQEAKQGILDEIEIIKKEMVTTQELNDAKDKIMGKFLLSLETNMDEANLLSWYSTLGLDLNAFDEYKQLIMNVTQSDIIETANKYFNKPYIYVVVKQK